MLGASAAGGMHGLCHDFLAQRRTHEEVEEKVASAFGESHEDFWSGIDSVLVKHYRGTEMDAGLCDISVC